MSRGRAEDGVIGVLLALATVLVYAPVRGYGFVSFDDPGYVAENVRVLTGLSVADATWAFTTFHFANWHPLTWLSFMTDVSLFGPDPGAIHLVNVVLHVANALLVYALFRTLTAEVWPSALVAGLFAVHPLNVESVAWISERKDVLCAFFGLLSLLAYERYVRRGSRTAYVASVGALALGLMAKPMLVTWPFVMLLLDVWPLGRIPCLSSAEGRRTAAWCAVEKLPHLVLAAGVSLLTVVAQSRSQAIAGIEHLGALARLANASLAYVVYLGKFVWPANLAPLYPHPAGSVSIAMGTVAAVGVAVLTALALRAARRCPAVGVGWLWFLGTLVPVIGLVQVGDQAYADRYTYLPALGLDLALAFGAKSLLDVHPRATRLAAASAGIALIALAWAASLQRSHWRSNLALFSHTLRVTRENTIAHTHYGNALLAAGRPTEAVAEYRAADAIHPGLAWNQVGLGNALLQQRDLSGAFRAFEAALERDPDSLDAHIGLGNVHLAAGAPQAALESFRRAIELSPDSAEARNNAGAAAGALGDLSAAIAYFESALARRPNYPDAAANLAKARQMRAESVAH